MGFKGSKWTASCSGIFCELVVQNKNNLKTLLINLVYENISNFLIIIFNFIKVVEGI